jgi:transcriptional regulator with XRE-family HTH domain
MTFAERLKQLREQAGLSQSELADASGVPVWTLRGYEQGRREPQWDVLFRLCAALKTTCEAFAGCVSSNGTTAQSRAAARTDKPQRGRRRKGQ